MSFLSNFSYGPHPSIIMWSDGSIVQEEDGFDLFGGISKKLESLVTSDAPENFNSFKFDAVISEEHSAENTVTKFPVSSGFVVGEHSIVHNRVLKLVAVAANMQNAAMWSASVQGMSVISGAIFRNPIMPIVGSMAGLVASTFETSDRIQFVYDLFNRFRVSGTKLYISTIVGQYLNCVVTKIATKHDKMNSSILQIEVTLEELQTIGDDELAVQARKSMENMYDYSGFVGVATSIGIGALGSRSLPGLGRSVEPPTIQLAALSRKTVDKEEILTEIKGRVMS